VPQLAMQSEERIVPSEGRGAGAGSLDGVTIMRYAHVYRGRASGGVEQYLRHLDRGLLQRHQLTLLQMHLVRDDADHAIEVENVGVGRIAWIPVPIRLTGSRLADLPARITHVRRTFQRDRQAGRSGAISSLLQNLFGNHCGHLRYKAAIFSGRLQRFLADQEVDLLALHWLSYDTGALTACARKTQVPFVFINHFDNARLSLPQVRRSIADAVAIGVISDRGIPAELRERCVNLSDAVDIEFFTPEKARPAPITARSLVLLPARIEAGKGHCDLIEAARILIARKFDLTIGLVGAVESESLHQELRRSVSAMGLGKQVLFLGEKTAEEIRDWYAMSNIVVLPSYAEGLGRVLLEAQAMEKPVVAYDCGGVREAVLPNETGFLLERGNVEALADKIGLLLENEEKRIHMGERGREFVSHRFSVSALIERHEAFYVSALPAVGRKPHHALASQ
jgi:glycosyltransferase involved in cell wall biosynthesis